MSLDLSQCRPRVGCRPSSGRTARHRRRHVQYTATPTVNGTYAKVRASLATALLRGKSIRRLYESLWFVPCLLAVCLLLKRFFSSLARFAGSSATHTLRKNICWFFFVASDRRRAGVTRRRRPLVDCATPPRHLSKKQKSKSLGINNVPAGLKIYICAHGELFTGCAVRFAVKISQEYCASEQWLVMQRTFEDCDRMLLKIEGLARVGEK